MILFLQRSRVNKLEQLYKGYVPTMGKKSQMPFKDKSSDDLLTLEQAQKFPEYATG